MNAIRIFKLRATIRGILVTLTYLFICLSLVALSVEFSMISSLKSQILDLDSSFAALKEESGDARGLKQRYLEKRNHAYFHERHITELIQVCRRVGDMPNLESEFLICEDATNNASASERWICVPEGNHQLQVHLSEFDGGIAKDSHVFSYDLLEKSAYRLRLRVPPPKVTVGVKPSLSPVPIELSIESNNPDYNTTQETLPIKFYPSHGVSRNFYDVNLSSLSLRFPGECFGYRESFRSAISMLDLDCNPTRNTSQLAGFAWRWKEGTVNKSLVISIEVLSDAAPCAAPFYSSSSQINAKFQPYTGKGRYLPVNQQ